MKIKPICCYKELSYGDENGDSIKNHINDESYEEKDRVIKYLESGICVAACTGVSEDVIDSKNGIIGVPDALTDGKYQWYADLKYYVEKYNLRPDKEFLDYMRQNDWQVKIKESDIDFDNIEYV